MVSLLRAAGRWRMELVMFLPLVIYILGFTLVPIIGSIKLSLTGGDGLFPTLVNYAYLFESRQFLRALFNTLIITGLGISLEFILGLTIALLLWRSFKGQSVIRTVLLTPLGVPTIVSGVMFTYFFSTNGYINEILFRTGLSERPVEWTAGGFVTILSIIVTDMWKVTPLMVLILLAGLEAIPIGVYEAAEVDGASRWQRFFHVTLPLLRPSITIAVILRAIDAFRIFEIPMLLTGRNLPVLGTFAYFEYYDYNNPHTSAAASTILLMMIAVFVTLFFTMSERRASA